MNMAKRKDMTLGGIFVIDGGTYGLVSLNGICRIKNDLDATGFTAGGAWAIGGSLKSGEARIKGTGAVAKDAALTSLNIDGALNVHGTLSVKEEVFAKGTLSATGAVKASHIDIEGTLKASSDVETESIDLRGELNIGGMLNADSIRLLFAGSNTAHEIGGSVIRIEPLPTSSFKNVFQSSPAFHCESIEADDIDISGTTAKVVRGARVHIGPNCNIELVEYSEELQIDPSSHVGEQRTSA